VTELLPHHQHLVTCAPRLAQRAALAALRHGDEALRRARVLYATRRQIALAALRAVAGLEVEDPGGGFYLWIDARRRLGMETRAFALAEAAAGSVLVVPGEAFGPAGAGFLRISVAAEEAQLNRGLERLGRAVERWRR
jgi:aspartate/methionine/tyrosine aminotransferase